MNNNRVPIGKWEHYGRAGHLIVGDKCRFHLCTVVGKVMVSTVGDYYPPHLPNADKPTEIGYQRTFETMVFPVGRKRCAVPECMCGQPMVTAWEEKDADGYTSAGEATKGHWAMCRKWASAAQQRKAWGKP